MRAEPIASGATRHFRLVLCSALVLAAAQLHASDETKRWFRHDEIDPLDQSRIPTVILPAQSGQIVSATGATLNRKAILVVRCRQHELQLVIVFDMRVTGLNREVKVLYAVDGAGMQAALFQTSPDETSFGAFVSIKSKPLIVAMMGSPHFSIRSKSDTGEQTRQEFDTMGMDSATLDIRSACNASR